MRRLPGILLATGATLIVIVALLISGLRLMLPKLNDYRPQLLAQVEKLSGVKSLEKAMEAQSDFARSSYETFVAETQKIAGLYSDLAKQAFKPVETIVAKFTPAAN